MIKARKIALFEFVFELYNRWLIRRRFNAVLIEGQRNLSADSSLPKILCLNHSSWWDGLVAYFLSRHFDLDGYCMMEEKQLSKLRPFTWIGAFSVVRENPREAARSILYAVKILKGGSRRVLWIFPQGEILPNDIRPINVFGGVAKIAEKSIPCEVLPIALRYEFLGTYKPSIFISVGEPEQVRSTDHCDALAEEISRNLCSLLDALRRRVTEGDIDDFTDLLR